MRAIQFLGDVPRRIWDNIADEIKLNCQEAGELLDVCGMAFCCEAWLVGRNTLEEIIGGTCSQTLNREPDRERSFRSRTQNMSEDDGHHLDASREDVGEAIKRC